MSKSAFTIQAFSVYLMVMGMILLFLPNLLLSLFAIPFTSEVWIRVVGVLVFNIGIYYWFAAKSEVKAFFMASVYARAFVLAAFMVFVAIGLTSPTLILFGTVDFLGGVWTFLALRAEQQNT